MPSPLEDIKRKNDLAIAQGIFSIALLVLACVYVVLLIIGIALSWVLTLLTIAIIVACPIMLKNAIKRLNQNNKE